MKKFIFKIVLYSILLFAGLELAVRVFHLHNEMPERFLDDREVERWIPNQSGVSVTGNRRQNVGHYRINDLGFNSVYDTYNATVDGKEIALVGDSFFQGFHQDYDISLGQKIEARLNEQYSVLEYGYAGYDLADELHLIQKYPEWFDPIDYIIVYLRCVDDLDRDTYEVSSRLSLDTPVSRMVRNIKSVVYLKDMGLIDPITSMVGSLTGLLGGGNPKTMVAEPDEIEIIQKRLSNFKSLIQTYGFDKNKNIILMDGSLCSDDLIQYLNESGIQYIDFSGAFEASEVPPTLIYDQHWNNQGRNILADLISSYIKDLNKNQ